MKPIRIASHTADEVNLESATQAARECGASLSRLAYPVARPSGAFAAVLHDLDHMDSQRGRAVVSELLSRPASFAAAVHGYGLEDEEMAILQANGVIVSQEFNAELVRALCRASEHSPAAGLEPPGRDSQEASDSDDPAVLCGMVRSLARHAHRTLRQSSLGTPNVIPDEIGELIERFIQLQQFLDRFRRQHHLALEDLQRWLDNLLRCVEDSLAQPPREVEGGNR
jgi:hypothetical protein